MEGLENLLLVLLLFKVTKEITRQEAKASGMLWCLGFASFANEWY